MDTHLHHGLVSTQSQEHARTQFVFSQGQQELLGLVAGAHQDVNLEQMKGSDGLVIVVFIFSSNIDEVMLLVQGKYTHHAGKELSVVITSHTPWTVELKPTVFS